MSRSWVACRVLVPPVVWAVALLATPAGPRAAAADFTGRVVVVSDGDTLTVLDGRTPVKVRLHGVDAPESGQAFGSRAKQAASALAFGKDVAVRPVTRDRYGRTVAWVDLPGGRTLNAEMVRAALAWWYREYAPNEAGLARLESEARGARVGLWSEPNPVPPWDWRGGRDPAAARVVRNRSSRVYHRGTCGSVGRLAERNRVEFPTEAAAVSAGYRPGRDCH